MGVLDDVLKALDRIPIWRRLGDVPEEVDDLKKRVAELENKLDGKWPPDVCRLCGERAARISGSHVEKVTVTEYWDCSACHERDFRFTKVS